MPEQEKNTEELIVNMKKWTIQDRYGHPVYITEERWRHILESRPELESLFDQFLETVKTGRRKQDALIPN